MKYVHDIKISVFSKPEDDQGQIKQTLTSLIPFDLETEKIKLNLKSATGFNERKITIIDLILSKDKHINDFLKSFFSKLNQDQKDLLKRQLESRLDDNLNFFIRLDMDKLIHGGQYLITDSGNCFHLRFSVAAFPKKRDQAIVILKKIIDEF